MKIKINGIKGQTIIGFYEYERNIPQDVIINLAVELYSSNCLIQDKLTATVNYDELIEFIQKLLPTTKYNLLESLAQYLTQEIFARFPLIKAIKISLIKPEICKVKALEVGVSMTSLRKFKVALALGSNITDLPQQQLVNAIELLSEEISNIQVGGFYETKPVGFSKQNNFYNTAITGITTLEPQQLFAKLKAIEKLMGKQEQVKNGPRIIDIDLILFDDLIYNHNFLTIPHKEAHLRDFVLAPLNDIAADWIHPLLNQSIGQLHALLAPQQRSIIQKINYAK